MTTEQIESIFRRAARRVRSAVHLTLHSDGFWHVTGYLGDAAHRTIAGVPVGRCLHVEFDDERGEGWGAIYERTGGGHVVVFPAPGADSIMVDLPAGVTP